MTWIKTRYNSVKTVPNLTKKIPETEATDTHTTHKHDHWLYWLGTGTSINNVGVKLVWWAHTSPDCLSTIKQYCPDFNMCLRPYVAPVFQATLCTLWQYSKPKIKMAFL